jgi:effector-binding domain-containing protein
MFAGNLGDMENPQVKVVQIDTDIVAVGKCFVGDYAASPKHASEVQNILTAAAIPFIPNKVMGVYYDNPETTAVENLKCFQGFFLENQEQYIDSTLSRLALKGKYLYTKVTGDPGKIVFDGYNALFSHIQENGIALKSNAGYQVSTFENNIVTVEIYMEIL